MQAIYLKFYVAENRRHRSLLAYEWLLEEAKKLGLHGGSAFRAIAGFGRHGRLHEAHFFELAGSLPVEVGFVVAAEDADRFVAHVGAEGLSLPYVRLVVDHGVTDGAAD
jgi:PII-like signaling protein